MNILTCEHPKRIYNKYLREYMFVPCGHCCVCKNRLSHNWVKRLEMESKCHQFSIFFTLTYNNNAVPTVQLVPDKFVLVPIQNFDTCIELDGILDDRSSKLFEFSYELKVLSVREVQLFIKRLRRLIDYEYEKGNIKEEIKPTIRYYINGEYGPTTFRPHHHGILWTDSRWVSEHFNDLLVKAWSKYDRTTKKSFPLGNVDWSFVDSSAARYVAQYVNCTDSLPKVFTSAKIKPFSVQSRHPALGTLFQSDSQIQEVFYQGLTEISFSEGDGKEVVSSPLLPSTAFRLFPKCARFSTLSNSLRVAIYRLGSRFPAETEFENDILWQNFLLDELKSDKFDFLRSWIDDVTSELKDLRPFIRTLNISRRVIAQAAVFGCSVEYYVSRIELFYSNLEKRNLRSYFQFCEDYSKQNPSYDLLFLDLDFIQKLYFDPSKIPVEVSSSYNVDSVLDFEYTSLECYKNLIQLNKQIYMKNCKTKKKNDYLLAHPELAMFNQI